MLECVSVLSIWVHKCPSNALQVPKCLSTLRVLSECPNARVLSECLKYLSTLWVSLNVHPVPVSNQMWLKRILSIKRCFMYMQNEKITALGKLLKLVLDTYFLQRLNLAFCVGTFKRNVRRVLMTFTLPLNRKISSEIPFN